MKIVSQDIDVYAKHTKKGTRPIRWRVYEDGEHIVVPIDMILGVRIENIERALVSGFSMPCTLLVPYRMHEKSHL